MSRFGWAYVNSLVSSSVANGPTNSIQFNSGSGILSGSGNFVFNPSTNNILLTGSIQIVSGTTIVTEMLNSGIRTVGKPVQVRNVSNNIVGVMDETGTISGSIGRYGTVTGSILTASSQLQVAGNSFLNADVIIGGNIVGSQGFKAGYALFTSSFSVTQANYFVGISTTGSVVTASLNSATNFPAGQTLIFKDVGGNAATNNILIKPSGSQTIDGAAGAIISTTSGSISIVSNGVDSFYIIGLA